MGIAILVGAGVVAVVAVVFRLEVVLLSLTSGTPANTALIIPFMLSDAVLRPPYRLRKQFPPYDDDLPAPTLALN